MNRKFGGSWGRSPGPICKDGSIFGKYGSKSLEWNEELKENAEETEETLLVMGLSLIVIEETKQPLDTFNVAVGSFAHVT